LAVSLGAFALESISIHSKALREKITFALKRMVVLYRSSAINRIHRPRQPQTRQSEGRGRDDRDLTGFKADV